MVCDSIAVSAIKVDKPRRYVYFCGRRQLEKKDEVFL
jgi:hypothetical protein